MWVYPRDVIDQNRFHNCVGESEKAILVALAFKDTIKTVMRDTTLNLKCIQSRLLQVLLFNPVLNPFLMT